MNINYYKLENKNKAMVKYKIEEIEIKSTIGIEYLATGEFEVNENGYFKGKFVNKYLSIEYAIVGRFIENDRKIDLEFLANSVEENDQRVISAYKTIIEKENDLTGEYSGKESGHIRGGFQKYGDKEFRDQVELNEIDENNEQSWGTAFSVTKIN